MTGDDRQPTLRLGEVTVTAADVVALARGELGVSLGAESPARERIRRSVELLQRHLDRDGHVYGVTTGFGASVGTRVPAELTAELALNLVRFHGCGTGRLLDPVESAAVLAVRLATLSRGYSGVREIVLERLCDLLNHKLLPAIPCEGSVGASGDLTPLSYVAAVLQGEREVLTVDGPRPAAEALTQAGLEPIRLQPKESLALMNGTSVMTALACLALDRAERLARLTALLTAGTSYAMRGNPAHFDARIFELKPHPGQIRAAEWIRADLEGATSEPPANLQDRYSLRCVPHVLGVLLDSLSWIGGFVEIEVNSVNDNPIFHAESGAVLHGGNFYGGHIGMAMDALKIAVASVADLLDRQLMALCDPAVNAGLPANLVCAAEQERVAHHGFKAATISASALAAEALKLTMPATSFSRSTELHNQDKVPMGTIAARDALRVLELTETVAAISTLAVIQAVELRGAEAAGGRVQALRAAVREQVPALSSDRRMDLDIDRVLRLYRAGTLLEG